MSRQNELETTSKFLSFLLRHHPEAAGITLDEHGWANVEELLAGVNQTRSLTSEQLELIVDSDAKKRYSFDKTHSRIRANQGHSIPVDVELKPCEPPEVLYHGTGEKFTASIEQSGLLPKKAGFTSICHWIRRQHAWLDSGMENRWYIWFLPVKWLGTDIHFSALKMAFI